MNVFVANFASSATASSSSHLYSWDMFSAASVTTPPISWTPPRLRDEDSPSALERNVGGASGLPRQAHIQLDSVRLRREARRDGEPRCAAEDHHIGADRAGFRDAEESSTTNHASFEACAVVGLDVRQRLARQSRRPHAARTQLYAKVRHAGAIR